MTASGDQSPTSKPATNNSASEPEQVTCTLAGPESTEPATAALHKQTSSTRTKTSASAILSLTGSERIGIYELAEELGRGGMGVVYKAWHPIRRRDVALKVILPTSGDQDGFEAVSDLFLREGAILMSISHPNVVQCFDCNVDDNHGRPILYMALELLDGQTLAARITQGPLPLHDVIAFAKAIAEALRALHTHSEKVLHRDVKPANVFLTQDGGVKLLDFGLAAIADWRLTQVSLYAAGSRPYMSPEQFEGLRFCTEASDLYSLGVTIFEMATGMRPFIAGNDQAFIDAHARRSPPLLREAAPTAEDSPAFRSLQNIVTKLLAKKPSERYPSAKQLILDLRRIEEGEGVQAYKVTRPEWERRKAAVKRALLSALVLLVVSIAVVLGRDFYRRDVRNPKLLQEAEVAVSELRLADGREVIDRILASDPNHDGARQLQGRIVELLGRQSEVARLREQAEAEGVAGRFLLHAQQAKLVEERAISSGAFQREQLATFAAWAEEAETRRRKGFREGSARVRAVELSDDEQGMGEALAGLQALARTDEERLELQRLQSRQVDRATIEAAKTEVESEQYQKAKSHLGRVDASRLDDDLREIALQLSSLVQVGTTLIHRDDPREALRLADLSLAERQDNRGEGKTPDWFTSRLKALRFRAERAQRVQTVLAGARAAKEGQGDWNAVRTAVVAARRALASSALPGTDDSQLSARLAKVEEEARHAIYENAMAEAAGLLHELAQSDADTAKARRAEIAARRALRNLPGTEAAPISILLQEYERDRRQQPAAICWEKLRACVRVYPHAERALLMLEEAHSSAQMRLGERRVPRSEGVTLGEASPYRRNPPHVVSLPPFYLDETELRSTTYAEAVSGGLVAAPAGWNGNQPPEGGDDRPVRGVSFADAQRYAESRGKRLPTPDEWEVAASVRPDAPGGPHRAFPWGDDWLEAVTGVMSPVGSTAHDRSPRGVLDMGGNVSEWTALRQADGRDVPCVKGGSSLLSERLLPGYRNLFRATHRSFALGEPLPFCGFRCARDVPVVDLGEFVNE